MQHIGNPGQGISKHYHFPSEENIVAYLGKHHFRTKDYPRGDAIITIAAKFFANTHKDVNGIEEGVREVLKSFSAISPTMESALLTISLNLEKALQDCAEDKVIEVKKNEKVKVNNPTAYATMTAIETVEDVKPFFGRIVAYCTTNDKKWGYEEYGYPIDADPTIKFGHINTTGHLGEFAYHIDRLLRPSDQTPGGYYVKNQRLKDHEWLMRLATRDEVEKIRQAILSDAAYLPYEKKAQALHALDKHLAQL